jgi:hypothetical protein
MNTLYEKIKNGLSLLMQNSGDGWIIIFEEPETEKFVQFALDYEEGLFFDCPSISFSEQEKQRAEVVMHRYNLKESSPSEDDFTTYNGKIGSDIEKASRLASDVFREVFLFNDDKALNITIRN